jgi:hypothetical protein
MRVMILDPWLFQTSGHHLAVSLLLARTAENQGHVAQVFGNKQLPELVLSVPVHRVFDNNPYSPTDGHELASTYLFTQENELVERTLKSVLPPAKVQAGDVFIVHTTMIDHLVGYYRWFRWLNRKDVALRMLLRYPPGYPRDRYRALESGLARFALQLWADAPGAVGFFSDVDGLSAHYTELSGLAFTTTPIAVEFFGTGVTARAPAGKRPLTWVFGGDARTEKGLGLLPQALPGYLKRYPNDTFRIQTFSADPQVLEALNSFGSCIEIIPRTLHGQDYLNHLASGDAVLLPYNPQRYWMRSSHILIEALGMGRGVVVSPDTWMSDELGAMRKRVGMVMREWTPDGLRVAMEAFASNAGQIMGNALAVAPTIRDTNNADMLLHALLS